MKKLILLLIAVTGISLGLLAQTTTESTTVSENYETMIATLGGFAVAVMAVVGAVKKLLPSIRGIAVQITSWVVAIVLSLLLWWLNAGMFAGLSWYIALLYGLGGALIANGLADVGIIQWIIELFRRKQFK